MTNRDSIRYPELPDGVSMDELVRRWSALIKVLGDKDKQPLDPAEIYGRNIEVGGRDMDNVVFVTAGTSLPIAPTPALWYIYQYQIPRDVGLVYAQPVSVSATANVQVQTFLPLAQSVEGRTITIAGGNTDGVTFGSYNLGIFPTSGSNDVIVPLLGGGISVTNTVGGSLSIDTTVSSAMTDISSNPVAPIYNIMALNGGTLYQTYAVSVGTSTAQLFGALRTGIVNNTTTSAAANITVSSVAVYTAPLNYTFRAFGNRWIQIA